MMDDAIQDGRVMLDADVDGAGANKGGIILHLKA